MKRKLIASLALLCMASLLIVASPSLFKRAHAENAPATGEPLTAQKAANDTQG